MEDANLKNISKTETDTFILYEMHELEQSIQRGNEVLLEIYGSQEAVDAHLQEVKEELYQKLFSTPVTCSKPNCSYMS